MKKGKIKGTINRGRHLFWSGVGSLKVDGVSVTARRVAALVPTGGGQKYWIEEELFTDEELEAQRKETFPRDITFSILMSPYNGDGDHLRESIRSVLEQTYSNWELCIADGSDKDSPLTEEICREFAHSDSRIKYRKLDVNKGMSGNLNEAIGMAGGEYISLMEQGDILHPAALHETMVALLEGADFIYTDEAVFEGEDRSKIKVINYKPDFGPDSLNGSNFIKHFTSFKKSLVEKTGAFRSEYDGSHDHELFLRLTDAAEHIAHIPEALYYRREISDPDEGSPLKNRDGIEAGARAVEDSLKAKGIDARVEPNGNYGYFYRVGYPIKGRPKISIIIPNNEHLDYLKKCLDSILEKSTYDNYEIIIVENNSRTKSLFDYYDKITSEHDNIKVIKWDGKFNYSAVNNFGVKTAAEGEYLLLLNNDTEVITPEWMEEMLMYVQRRDVGAAGAKLYYPDDTVQHAGVVLGLGSVAGHVSMRSPREDGGYMGRNIFAQNYSAVTGACMMIRRDVWEEVGGLDEAFAVAYNDVDFCLKVREAGYLIVWTPFAELYHYESKSRGANRTPGQLKTHLKEVNMLRERWSDFLEKGDPYYNPNFTLYRPDYMPKTRMRQFDNR